MQQKKMQKYLKYHPSIRQYFRIYHKLLTLFKKVFLRGWLRTTSTTSPSVVPSVAPLVPPSNAAMPAVSEEGPSLFLKWSHVKPYEDA